MTNDDSQSTTFAERPTTPPTIQPDRRYFLNMTGVSAAEISEYETIGFVVLRKRVDPVLVQKARDAVTKKVQDTRKTVREDRIFVTVCEEKDWPSQCQTLYEAIEVGIR